MVRISSCASSPLKGGMPPRSFKGGGYVHTPLARGRCCCCCCCYCCCGSTGVKSHITSIHELVFGHKISSHIATTGTAATITATRLSTLLLLPKQSHTIFQVIYPQKPWTQFQRGQVSIISSMASFSQHKGRHIHHTFSASTS